MKSLLILVLIGLVHGFPVEDTAVQTGIAAADQTDKEPVPQNACQPSTCGPNSQCTVVNNQAVCSCLPDYVGNPPNCVPECVVNSDCLPTQACANQKCIDPCPGTCGLDAQCQVTDHGPICTPRSPANTDTTPPAETSTDVNEDDSQTRAGLIDALLRRRNSGSNNNDNNNNNPLSFLFNLMNMNNMDRSNPLTQLFSTIGDGTHVFMINTKGVMLPVTTIMEAFQNFFNGFGNNRNDSPEDSAEEDSYDSRRFDFDDFSADRYEEEEDDYYR